MNNLTLGNDGFTYYETLGGGQGACPEADGPSDVHVAMRRGSGGSGRQKGGEGVVRELEALEAMHYPLITERRRRAPQGASGGEDGQSGRDLLTREGGEPQELAPKASGELRPGDRLRVETPGGGGCGAH